MPSIYDNKGGYTAFGLRAGYKQHDHFHTKDHETYVTVTLAFHQSFRKYYISTHNKGFPLGANSEYIGRVENARKRFEEIKEAVAHAVDNEYLQFN